MAPPGLGLGYGEGSRLVPRPFYVGDLVTLNKTGDMAMTEAVVGWGMMKPELPMALWYFWKLLSTPWSPMVVSVIQYDPIEILGLQLDSFGAPNC